MVSMRIVGLSAHFFFTLVFGVLCLMRSCFVGAGEKPNAKHHAQFGVVQA